MIVMVPPIRKTMETLIFEVKLMLENNDAGAAFWLGNLKHRNLRGEEISSQLPVSSDDDHDNTRYSQQEGNEDEGDQGSSHPRSGKKNVRKRSRTDTHKPKSTSRKTSKDSRATGNATKKRNTQQPRNLAHDDGLDDNDHEHRIHTKRQVYILH